MLRIKYRTLELSECSKIDRLSVRIIRHKPFKLFTHSITCHLNHVLFQPLAISIAANSTAPIAE